jgi:hypothetical protein
MLVPMRWLVISVGLSIVLTVLANLLVRAFPDGTRRVARRLEASAWPSAHDHRRDEQRVRVLVPWKAMIIGSVVLTVVVNLVRWLA